MCVEQFIVELGVHGFYVSSNPKSDFIALSRTGITDDILGILVTGDIYVVTRQDDSSVWNLSEYFGEAILEERNLAEIFDYIELIV